MLRRYYPGERRFKVMRAFWMGLFFWGLALGCCYVVYLALNVP